MDGLENFLRNIAFFIYPGFLLIELCDLAAVFLYMGFSYPIINHQILFPQIELLVLIIILTWVRLFIVLHDDRDHKSVNAIFIGVIAGCIVTFWLQVQFGWWIIFSVLCGVLIYYIIYGIFLYFDEKAGSTRWVLALFADGFIIALCLALIDTIYHLAGYEKIQLPIISGLSFYGIHYALKHFFKFILIFSVIYTIFQLFFQPRSNA